MRVYWLAATLGVVLRAGGVGEQVRDPYLVPVPFGGLTVFRVGFDQFEAGLGDFD